MRIYLLAPPKEEYQVASLFSKSKPKKSKRIKARIIHRQFAIGIIDTIFNRSYTVNKNIPSLFEGLE